MTATETAEDHGSSADADTHRAAAPPVMGRQGRLPFGEAQNLDDAVFCLRYVLGQIEGCETYHPNIGQVNSATSGLRLAIAALAAGSDPLADARDAFLNMVADAKKWEFETDGEYDDEGRASCWSTVTMVSDHSQLQELCDALGMVGPYDEFIEDRIARYIEMPAKAVSQ